MRISKNILAIIILINFWSCENDEGIQQFPIISTLDVSDNNQLGATFNAEVIYSGTEATTEYGFVWCLADASPTITDHKVELGTPVQIGQFNARIEFLLAKGLKYNVRSYSIYKNRVVYGNMVQFISEGSENSPYRFIREIPELDHINDTWSSYVQGAANNQFGYMIFGNDETHQFDPFNNSVTKIDYYHGGVVSPAISLNNTIYFFDHFNSNLDALENNKWSTKSVAPFAYGPTYENRFGFSHINSFTLLSTEFAYAYEVASDTWVPKKKLNHTSPIVAGAEHSYNAYVITSDKKIFKYNPFSETWSAETDYPGTLKEKTIGFAFGDKVYFGFSHDRTSGNMDWMTNELWSYNINTKTWEECKPFPLNLNPGYIFSFYLNKILYIGYKEADNNRSVYNLYSVDPSKI